MKELTKALAIIILMAVVVCAAGCKKTNDPNHDGNNNGGNQSNHEYVDLGLPSGTLWATCNVGATRSSDYGDYFAWGETERKEVYDWSTYKWCNGVCQLTKYCNNSSQGYEGFTDILTILHSSDDAATVNWGKGWRTPTMEQWQELENNTASAWTTQNDVYGRVFYGNGQSLFLPAAGRRWEGEVYSAGSSGDYWSGSLYTGNSYSARRFYFSSDDCGMGYYARVGGLPVRAVCGN